jgi:hypothetical protein
MRLCRDRFSNDRRAISGCTVAAHHLSQADKLDRQVKELSEAGKYSEAIPIATQSLRLREQALGPDQPATASSLTMSRCFMTKWGTTLTPNRSINARSKSTRKR